MANFPLILDIKKFKSLYPEYNVNLLTDAILNDLWLSVNNIAPAFINRYKQEVAESYYFKILAHYCQLRLTKQAGRLIGANQSDTTSTFEAMGLSAGSLQWWCQTVWGQEIAQLMRRAGGITYIK